MGKIVLVVGPHGVGKTSLFDFAKTKDEFLVFDGFQLPSDDYDLNTKKDFLAYEMLYINVINQNNRLIKQSNRNGLVVRSIEESSYYFHFYRDSSVVEKYQKIFDDANNIKADYVFFLDANRDTLNHRCQNDYLRDMSETHWWYEHEYDRYVDYWKHYPGIIVIDTVGKTTESVYIEIKQMIASMR